MNIIDFSVVMLSSVELFINTGINGIIVLRAFRVLRVTRLFRYLNLMQTILVVISKSLSKIFYLAMLLVIFIIIFALLGSSIFLDKF